MTVLHPLEKALAAAWPPALWQEVSVVLAVSGGGDSVALTRAVRALKTSGAGQVSVAHFNHRLRGAESDADQDFVVDLCRILGLECTTGAIDPQLLQSAGDGIESAARDARYRFLRETAERRGARYLVTAHTADDQAETILHHVLRGTGLAGLAGIPTPRALGPAVTVVRPLLEVTRAEIEEYLASLRQSFRHDASNRDLRFTRNRIRHELLPLLERDYSTKTRQNLLRLGGLAAAAQRVVSKAANELLERVVIEQKLDRVSLDCRDLASEDIHLVREMLLAIWKRQSWPQKAMGFDEWNALADMAMALPIGGTVNRKQVFPGAITAQREGGELRLTRAGD